MPSRAIRLLLCGWLLGLSWAYPARAQTPATDSLRRILAHTPPDSTRVLLLLELARTYRASQPDSTMDLAQRAWQLARQVAFDKGRGRAQSMVGMVLRERGELPKAFANQLIALRITHQSHDLEGEAYSLNCLGNISFDLRQYAQAVRYYRESEALYRHLHLMYWVAGSLTNIGSSYEKMDQLDSALALQQRAEILIAENPRPRVAAALALRNMGAVQARLGNYPAAFAYYRRSLRETYTNNDLRNRAMAQYRIAMLHNTLHQPDSSLLYAQRALQVAQNVSYRLTVMEAGDLLARLYQARHDADHAFRYQGLSIAARDSLFGPEKFRQLQLLAFNEQHRQLKLREAQQQQTAGFQKVGLLSAVGVVLTIALLLGWANRRHRRTNQLLNERNAKIEAQHHELSTALTELRSTQTQLVAAEKLAFVGEMLASIAHGLQDPLTAMQNVANVSVALLSDGAPGPAQPAALKHKIAAGLRQNLQEISQQGQRVSAIITDMLAHAHTGSGQPTPTDLNALVAEYLLLTDYGQPAPGAAAIELHTDFAAGLPPVPVVAPELGRALLYVFNNALYTVRQRQQVSGPGYQPMVDVSTHRVGTDVEIRVRDNGMGMTEAVVAQVFQPFFTTKAAGEGTGLGMSLAHDIVAKVHHGTLAVATQVGEFTEFTVRIPA